MRRFLQLSAIGFATVLVGCHQDTSVADPVPPTAGIRFINAVPDTGAAYGLDFRFVDLVENSAAFRQPFRDVPVTDKGTTVTASTGIEYKPTAAGVARHFKVFLSDTVQSLASLALIDSTGWTPVANHHYTAILWGNATVAGSMKLIITDDDTVQAAAGKVKLRVINATGSAIDVSTWCTGTAAGCGAAPATATWAAVAPYTMSAYVPADTGVTKYRVASAGAYATCAGTAATCLFADMVALPGAPANCDFSACPAGQSPDIMASPGTQISGSGVTLIVFPASVAGTRAAQFKTPGGSFMWDIRPPRPPGT